MVCVSLYHLSGGRINDRQRETIDGDKRDDEGRSEGEMMVGWEEKGEETQSGKLSLICLSRGIFGLPLAINLVRLLCRDRGTSRVGGACVSMCLNVIRACECTLTGWTPYRAKKLQETDFFSYFFASFQGHRCLAEGRTIFLFARLTPISDSTKLTYLPLKSKSQMNPKNQSKRARMNTCSSFFSHCVMMVCVLGHKAIDYILYNLIIT